MADQALHQAPTISSTFPNPPDFLWRDFNPEKISRFEELKKTWQEEHPDEAETNAAAVKLIPDIPEDLRHLQPPPEPADGSWRLYGDLFTLKDELPTLEAMGVPRLIPSTTANNTSTPADANRHRALNLKRLAKSVLLNFLELVGAASINPDGILEKAADIQNILINMHHGINEYRPHQARESLIQTMQARLDQIRAETAAVNAVTDKAKRVLEGLGSIEVPMVGNQGSVGKGVVEEVVYGHGDEEMWDEAAEFA
ncbi:Mediator of RNA polymerase II transcription subunit 7 [Cytospora mali]|uniref:Mediator of RNA polymerase II transcription subunit 7 n=1 Tax=Cytospora mali TaxID=578113 RepID=A0A194VDS8_CYTMA|nr:Mediator of RNA polymerase II transcription subunit 7 [Valsa mali var. pyri (nom. inval.)]